MCIAFLRTALGLSTQHTKLHNHNSNVSPICQDTVVDIQSLSPEQSHFFEAPQPSLSPVQVAGPKEKPKSSVTRMPAQVLESDVARAPAQASESRVARTPPLTLESQVQDLGGQVHDLDRQFKTMENRVQGILTHVQRVTAMTNGLDVDTPEWLGEQEMATAMPETATLMPTKARMGLKVRKDRPQPMELLQNVMEDVKALKEAHEQAQGKRQELPELTSQKLLQRIEDVEKKLRDREEFLELLNRKMSVIPAVEDATMVTWEDLEQAITDGWKALQVVKKPGGGAPPNLPLFTTVHCSVMWMFIIYFTVSFYGYLKFFFPPVL